jgi:hypothetical protein
MLRAALRLARILQKRSIAAMFAMAGLAMLPGGLLQTWASSSKDAADPGRLFRRSIPKEVRIGHALNRLTFGPRPGDAARVKAMGLKKWLDLELYPDRIPENPVLARKLEPLDSLFMTTRELVANYPEPQMVRQMVNGRLPFPSDPDRRMIIQKLAERFEKRQKAASPLPTPEQVSQNVKAAEWRLSAEEREAVGKLTHR